MPSCGAEVAVALICCWSTQYPLYIVCTCQMLSCWLKNIVPHFNIISCCLRLKLSLYHFPYTVHTVDRMGEERNRIKSQTPFFSSLDQTRNEWHRQMSYLLTNIKEFQLPSACSCLPWVSLAASITQFYLHHTVPLFDYLFLLLPCVTKTIYFPWIRSALQIRPWVIS